MLVDFVGDKQPKLAGLYAEGRLETESRTSLTLPATAVVRDGDSVSAFRVKDNKQQKVPLLSGEVALSFRAEHTWEVGGTVRAQPSVVDGWIYVGTEDGRLVAIDTGEATLTGWAMWGGNAARTGMTPGS